MYATIRRYEPVAGPADDLIPDGRRLASAVSTVSGFVAYALPDTGDGVLVSLSVFESEAGLAEAEGLAERWLKSHPVDLLCGGSEVGAGEVIVQKGL